MNTRARLFSNSSKAPAAASDSSTRLLTAGGLNAVGEIGKVGELALAARSDESFDRLLADAFERRQRIDDGVALDLEGNARAMIEGGSTRMPSRSASALNSASLSVLPMSSVIDAAQELDRVIRLHVRRSDSDPARKRRRALVEAVFGEALEQVENGVGLMALDPRARCCLRRSPCAAACISLRIFLPMARRSRSAWPSE